MASSQARIEANRRNGALSKGPVTEAGKSISRQNSLKHGLTGAGIVLPEGDAREVERRTAVYAQELGATGEVGMTIARRAALNSVRMERAVDQQTQMLNEKVRQVRDEFEAPEGTTEADFLRLRDLACRRAMLDTSAEAILARKYEAAAEGFAP